MPGPGSWVCVFQCHFSFPHIAYFFSLKSMHWYLKILLLQMKLNDLCIGLCALPFMCGPWCFTYAGGIIVHAYICRNWSKNEIAAAKSRGKFEFLFYCLNLTIGRCVLWLICLWESLMAIGKCRQLYANKTLATHTLLFKKTAYLSQWKKKIECAFDPNICLET